jgi:hypothetical protein
MVKECVGTKTVADWLSPWLYNQRFSSADNKTLSGHYPKPASSNPSTHSSSLKFTFLALSNVHICLITNIEILLTKINYVYK